MRCLVIRNAAAAGKPSPYKQGAPLRRRQVSTTAAPPQAAEEETQTASGAAAATKRINIEPAGFKPASKAATPAKAAVRAKAAAAAAPAAKISTAGTYWAVSKGKEAGVFAKRDEALQQAKNYLPGAVFRRFETKAEAERWMGEGKQGRSLRRPGR